MIVRGGLDLHEIYDKLDRMGYLGPTIEPVLKNALASHGGTFWKIKKDTDSLATFVNSSYPKSDHPFRFLLPHSLGSLAGADGQSKCDIAAEAFLKRFNQIEEFCRKEHKLSIHRLCLEHEQGQYYEDFPGKIPAGWRSDRKLNT